MKLFIYSCIDLLIDLLKKSEFGSLTKVELSSKLIDNFLWELSLVNLDVLDVFSSIKLDLKDADWLLFLLSLSEIVVEFVVSGLWAGLNLWSVVVASVSVGSRSLTWLLELIALWSLLAALSERVRWVLLLVGSGGSWVGSWHISVSLDHLLRSSNGVSLSNWGSRGLWLQSAELLLLRSSISSWGLLLHNLLLWGSWIVWGLWLSSILWFSISLLSKWILLNLLWSNHLSLNWLRSINWLLLNRSLLLNNSSYWLSSWSLGRDGSVLFHSSVGLWSRSLCVVVNWLLFGELSIDSLLLSVWRVSKLIDWTLGRVLWINSSLLLQVRFVSFELFSFLKVSSSISVIEHVSELIVDHLDLLVSQSISFPIDQTLNSSELVNKNKLWVVSLIVDSIKISL